MCRLLPLPLPLVCNDQFIIEVSSNQQFWWLWLCLLGLAEDLAGRAWCSNCLGAVGGGEGWWVRGVGRRGGMMWWAALFHEVAVCNWHPRCGQSGASSWGNDGCPAGWAAFMIQPSQSGTLSWRT
jgi:hypothetical protein